jgi:hypothetical protein
MGHVKLRNLKEYPTHLRRGHKEVDGEEVVPKDLSKLVGIRQHPYSLLEDYFGKPFPIDCLSKSWLWDSYCLQAMTGASHHLERPASNVRP